VSVSNKKNPPNAKLTAPPKGHQTKLPSPQANGGKKKNQG